MDFLEKIDSYAETDRIAQIYKEDILTYKELKEKSDALACYFIEKLKSNKKPIIIYGHKNKEIIISFLACAKAGHAYIPVDTTFPVRRVYDIIENSNCKIVLNFSEEVIKYDDIEVINLNSIYNIFENFKEVKLEVDNKIKDEDLFYILYTSGSTGKPKGVKILKKCVQNFVTWFENECRIEEEDGTFMNQVSYSFDVSVISLYIGLSNGKTLYVIDKHMINNFQELFHNLSKSKISLWISTPSFLEMCIVDNKFNKELLPYLKKIVVAGEVLTKNLANKIFENFPKVKLINGYGPTETTVLVTSTEITKELIDKNESIPIGHCGKNIILNIKDENGENIREDCKKGELYVAGESVSTGYYNNDENTKGSFYNDYIDGNLVRVYKTGDLVYKKNGLLYYCGRKDFQIKLNGFRIELEDIEKNLLKIDFVENAVVLPVKKERKIVYLAAFVKLNKQFELKNFQIAMKIKDELNKLIPNYMVPRKIKIKENFQLNVNGKIDRKLLLEEL
ncbi:D-alanine--poly(phosphoribitol) ligase subunit 1 [Clostridium sporogenes]|uniref:D-alanine--poly(phosphoribitol) ligase subunit DltA n=1 Tax=Clostridium TaxID=1485 RepID=UPI00090A10BD|nr:MULTISPECIES: D-alanine--poly(phosphoribitol) ligase subunit DltA [Clostridium]APF27540.1 D-alanine--poly(phosphoribitol) ligase subunit 1 [Clostridium sporogenes]MDI6919309.1 D-alanine--poly(phosphoribitol) ligase subunit DltA [Clostridium botulinum]WMU97171.1 D-alanine--poly(phosphoribitol) ligase subunit DltA [Clostridium botulinum]